ncbi:MAG: hypothetical protein GY861_04830 [bacterium]|nr:hypothetical protein [bacterium]
MPEVVETVKTAIDKVLEGRSPHVELLDLEPLFLLLSVDKDRVGFASLNGKPLENYDEALNKFRALYADHASDWADCDLTLVLCVKTVTDDIVADLIRIEVDPYFCRKFVIDVTENLQQSFKVLPFVSPLPSEIASGKRPISAQSFLTQHDVPAKLAEGLVVPQRLSEKTIVKGCLSGRFGELDWIEPEKETFLVMPDSDLYKSDQVRIKELEIKDFRAYRGTRTSI